MTGAVADTHALIWYLEDSPHLGTAARETFDACDRGETVVYVPTICLVELVYLQEKGRISPDLKTRFDIELKAGSSGLVLVSLTPEVADAVASVP
jgi:PIN domain nuclease of toxin-antitoxin system